MVETREFQADIHELLNLIVHSFYSNRDIFLRELVSNASDALEKQRQLDIQRSRLNEVYEIRIDPLSLEKQLLIVDNGVGMSEEDVITKLSTIAKSGTKELLSKWNKESTTDLIGQFGVGFYSAFLVATTVDVLTRSEGQPYVHWVSNADPYYTLEVLDENEIPEQDRMEHGTRILISIKSDCEDYLNESTIRKVLNQYSSFIRHPIYLLVEKEREIKTEEEPVTTNEETEAVVTTNEETEATVTTEEEEATVTTEEEEAITEENDSEVVLEDMEGSEDEEDTATPPPAPTPAKEIQKEKYRDWDRLNENTPIWYRPIAENQKEDYESLYKSLTGNWEAPLFWRQFQTEGTFEFRGILFVPSRAPFDMMGKYQEKRKIQVYVKRVLILSDLERDMLPDWMGFITGVIDSSDLPLNASREMLQQTAVVKAMKSQLKKQILTMLSELYTKDELYSKFYAEFHKNLKLGIHEGDESLLTYLRVKNSKDEKDISLEDYIQDYRVNEDQKTIYYVTETNENTSSLGKVYIEKGYTLIRFTDAIDEFMLQKVSKFKELDLVNINKDHSVPWESTSTTSEETDTTQKTEFCQWLKDQIQDVDIDQVRISTKLVQSSDDPGLLLASKWGWTGSMETIMKAQPLQDNRSMSFMKGKKSLEINWNHPYIQELFQNYSQTPDEKKNVSLFYYGCLISAGYPIEKKLEVSQSIFQALQC